MPNVMTFTEAGGHAINEDAFVARQHSTDSDQWIVGLADGQGGRAGGASAAQIAVQTVERLATNRSVAELRNAKTWQTLLRAADQAVTTDAAAGFTTLVGLGVRNGAIVGASSGDSAALAVCGSGATYDLTAHQVKNPPVGSGFAHFVPFQLKSLLRPWRLLVMSDGVWKYGGWNRIVEIAKRASGRELMEDLQHLVKPNGAGGFPDDFTVVLVEGTV